MTTTNDGAAPIDALRREGWLELPVSELESLRTTMIDTVLAILACGATPRVAANITESKDQVADPASTDRPKRSTTGDALSVGLDQQVLLSAAVSELTVIDDALHALRSAAPPPWAA